MKRRLAGYLAAALAGAALMFGGGGLLGFYDRSLPAYRVGVLTPLVLQVLSSPPGSPGVGWEYYDSALSQIGVYSGSAWVYF